MSGWSTEFRIRVERGSESEAPRLSRPAWKVQMIRQLTNMMWNWMRLGIVSFKKGFTWKGFMKSLICDVMCSFSFEVETLPCSIGRALVPPSTQIVSITFKITSAETHRKIT